MIFKKAKTKNLARGCASIEPLMEYLREGF